MKTFTEDVIGVWRACAARGVRVRAPADWGPSVLPAAGARREGVLLDVHCPYTEMLLDKVHKEIRRK